MWADFHLQKKKKHNWGMICWTFSSSTCPWGKSSTTTMPNVFIVFVSFWPCLKTEFLPCCYLLWRRGFSSRHTLGECALKKVIPMWQECVEILKSANNPTLQQKTETFLQQHGHRCVREVSSLPFFPLFLFCLPLFLLLFFCCCLSVFVNLCVVLSISFFSFLPFFLYLPLSFF